MGGADITKARAAAASGQIVSPQIGQIGQIRKLVKPSARQSIQLANSGSKAGRPHGMGACTLALLPILLYFRPYFTIEK
jgi:hypothetical protein